MTVIEEKHQDRPTEEKVVVQQPYKKSEVGYGVKLLHPAFNNIRFTLGLLTSEADTKDTKYTKDVELTERVRRTPSNRFRRAAITNAIEAIRARQDEINGSKVYKAGEKSREEFVDQKLLLSILNELDNIDRGLLRPRQIDVECFRSTVGTRYRDIQPSRTVDDVPVSQKDEFTRNLTFPPVFLIPAFCGDAYGVENFIRELVLSGRRVICIDFPESMRGRLTEQLVRQIKANGFDAYAEFFHQAIFTIMAGNSSNLTFNQIDLMGYSTGCSVITSMLRRSSLSNIRNVNLIAPAGFKKRNKLFPLPHTLAELADFNQIVRGVQDTGLVLDKPNDPEQRRLRAEVDTEALRLLRQGQSELNAEAIQGEVVIVSGGRDRMTDSAKVNWGEKGQKVKATTIPDASHVGLMTRAKEVVEFINQG